MGTSAMQSQNDLESGSRATNKASYRTEDVHEIECQNTLQTPRLCKNIVNVNRTLCYTQQKAAESVILIHHS